MKYDAELVEYVVREVIRRLTAAGSPAAPGAGATAPGGRCRELALADPVVTLGTLQGRLDGVTAVTIRRQAVITPSARDELAQRKITWKRAEP